MRSAPSLRRASTTTRRRCTSPCAKGTLRSCRRSSSAAPTTLVTRAIRSATRCRRSPATVASTRSRPCSKVRSRAGLRTSGSRPGEIDYEQDADQLRFDRAVHDGKRKDVERLLAARPELARNALSSWAEGVLMMPAKKRDRPLLDLLLKHGAQVPDLSKWGRFYYFKHDDVAALLLAHGMNARHRTWHGVTLLHDMAQSGDAAKARLLLENGAEIDAVEEEYRSTPLGLAARWGRRADRRATPRARRESECSRRRVEHAARLGAQEGPSRNRTPSRGRGRRRISHGALRASPSWTRD